MSPVFSEYILTIYFPLPLIMDAPFSNAQRFAVYRQFAEYCQKENIAVRFVRADSYLGAMSFSGGWYFDSKGVLIDCAAFKADLIINKSGLQKTFDKDDLVLNDPFIEKICSDKLVTYEYLSKYFAKTVPLDLQNPTHSLRQIRSPKIVVKPIDGAAGRGIFFLNQGESLPEEVQNTSLTYLAQEFLDSSAGILGLVQGMHDLRLFIFNGKVKIAYIRTPEQGSYLANIACGGSIKLIDSEEIPKEVLEMAKNIDDLFKHLKPRFYSADFMYAKGQKPYLIELNSHPGFPSLSYATPQYIQTYFESLLEIIR